MNNNSNEYNSAINGGVGKYSRLQDRQVYSGKDTYDGNNKYKKDSVYKNDSVYGEKDQRNEDPKYKRFADLKILNENMMHMSNNTLPDDSRIEILSQGEKGEIKNILSYRILKISIVPALMSLALGLVVMLTDSYIVTLFSIFVYFAVLVRTFFYPAKLYYENIRYKTTKPARVFFEEMDYWYKVSVVKVYVYMVIASSIMFVASFYQDEIVELLIDKVISTPGFNSEFIYNYIASISFSIGLKGVAILNIVILVFYSKFANKEKDKAEADLQERMKKIRNETLSRVQQIQEDKS